MKIDWSKFDDIVHSGKATNEELSKTESILYILDKVLYGQDIYDFDFDAFSLSDAESALEEVSHYESEGDAYDIYFGEVQVFGLHSGINEVFRKSHLHQICIDVKKYKRKFI